MAQLGRDGTRGRSPISTVATAPDAVFPERCRYISGVPLSTARPGIPKFMVQLDLVTRVRGIYLDLLTLARSSIFKSEPMNLFACSRGHPEHKLLTPQSAPSRSCRSRADDAYALEGSSVQACD
jgi:hypothetical protein